MKHFTHFYLSLGLISSTDTIHVYIFQTKHIYKFSIEIFKSMHRQFQQNANISTNIVQPRQICIPKFQHTPPTQSQLTGYWPTTKYRNTKKYSELYIHRTHIDSKFTTHTTTPDTIHKNDGEHRITDYNYEILDNIKIS